MIDMSNRVLAPVDQSRFADHVADYAIWAARRLDAPVEFLHVIDRHPEQGSGEDHSGAIGFNAQQHLLAELSSRDEAHAREARERGRMFLNQLRERAVGAGLTAVDVRQRHGRLDETLIEHEAGVRLFVLGRRGESAETTRRDLGRNVERVARALKKPILTVTEGFRVPQRILIAFDGGGLSRKGVDMVAASPLFRGLEVHLLMSGKPRQDAPRQLEAAAGVLRQAGFSPGTELVPGDAEQIIARAVRDRQVDLLVMGAYSHSPWRSLFMGSKTSDLLRAAAVPSLLLC